MAFFFSHHNRPNVTLTGEERLDVTYTYFPQPDISVTRSYIGPPQPPEDAVETVVSLPPTSELSYTKKKTLS